jgi:hypothetical protein
MTKMSTGSYVIVRAGKHHGRVHKIVREGEHFLDVLHEPTGERLTVEKHDVDKVEVNGGGR